MNCFRILSAVVAEVSGVDSLKYLNGRLSNDISICSEARGCLAAALTPQGQTQGLFFVYAAGADTYRLVCLGEDRESVLSAVSRFIVADQVEVADLSDELSLLHVVSEQALELFKQELELETVLLEEFYLLKNTTASVAAVNRLGQLGFDVVSTKGVVSKLLASLRQAGLEELSLEAWTLARIKANIPSFPLEFNPRRILAEAELPAAVSLSKGCYVGQEVVAKIDSLGKAPQQLVRLKLNGLAEFALRESVSNEQGAKVGELLSSAADAASGETYCYASLKSGMMERGLQVKVGELMGEVF